MENEYESELKDRLAGNREAMDPYVYDLYHAVRYIEEFGGEPREVVKSSTNFYRCKLTADYSKCPCSVCDVLGRNFIVGSSIHLFGDRFSSR